ncbi:MAG: ParB N-terminal domain-containing protein [Emcibacteraceae bacterium]|nr:ParB N-terminal domain-containing protein [Emcibacteraceae bacterium]
MKIKQRKIAELNPADYNPRQLTDKQYKQLKKSLKTFGCVEPVVVNSNPMRKDVIIGGHQRCKVWADLGNDSIPTVEVELDEAQEMELNVRLNKNTGEFDFDMLSSYFDMETLKDWGFQDYEFGMSLDDDMTDEFDLPDGDKEPFQQMTFTLADAQAEAIKEALSIGKMEEVETFGNENGNGNALYAIVKQWVEQKI